MKGFFKAIIVGLLAVNSSFRVFAEQNKNLLVNGDFEAKSDKLGLVPGWVSKNKNWKIINEASNNHLYLKNDSEKSGCVVSQTIKIKPEWKALKLTAKVRVKSIKRGKLNWHDARLALRQSTPGTEHYYPNVLFWKVPKPEWKEYSINIPIKAGRETITISPAIFNAVGELEVDELHLSVDK